MGDIKSVEANCDMISILPESVLLHILSFLLMEDVIRTSVLSKSWKYLWKLAPSLDFKQSWSEGKISVIDLINRSLNLYEGGHIDIFRVHMNRYDVSLAHQVDAWILFAVQHNVKELNIAAEGSHLVKYELPSCLFLCRSLVKLVLEYCQVKYVSSLCFPLLKTLTLNCVKIMDGKLHDVLSSCPILENLHITECMTEKLIVSTDLPLKTLTLVCNLPSITVNAPRALCLNREGDYEDTKYKLSNLQSLVKATVDFKICPFLEYDTIVSTIQPLKELLGSLSHVKQLTLGSWCVQTLQVREEQKLDSPQLSATCLKLCIGLAELEIPGLAHLLRRSGNIDTLILKLRRTRTLRKSWKGRGDPVVERNTWKCLKHCFSSILQSLKTVKIYNFLSEGSTYFLSDVGYRDRSSESYIKFKQSEYARKVRFMEMLMQNAKALEKVEIHLGCIDTENMTERLLAIPKASSKAEIIFA